MKCRSLIVLVSALALAVGVTSAKSEDLVLGYLPASAGPFATYSRTNLIAAQIAVDEINGRGGINGRHLKIVSFDTGGKPDQAVVGLRKLADDEKVIAIVGPLSSGECRVVFPAAERAGVVVMSMASSAPKLAEPFTYAFRNTTDEGVMFGRVVESLKKSNVKSETAAIAYATDDVIAKSLGEIIMPAILTRGGVQVKKSVTFQSQAFDLAPQVSQLLSEPTDLVAVGSGPEAAVRLVQEMRRQGHKARLIAGSTISDPDLPKLMGVEGEGSLIPTAFYSELNDRTKKFNAEFINRAKAAGLDRSAAAQFDASTYDIVLMYAEAMKRANVSGQPQKLAEERKAIRDQLRAMNDFPALEGPISFGKNGDALKPVYILEVSKGRYQLFQHFSAHAP